MYTWNLRPLVGYLVLAPYLADALFAVRTRHENFAQVLDVEFSVIDI